MIDHHSWARKCHDFPNLMPHIRPIAMYFAVGAESFLFHKRAVVAAFLRILQDFPALCTHTALVMVLFTIQPDHLRYDLFLPFPFPIDGFHVFPLTHIAQFTASVSSGSWAAVSSAAHFPPYRPAGLWTGWNFDGTPGSLSGDLVPPAKHGE